MGYDHTRMHYKSDEEEQAHKILISLICLYGNDGLPLDQVSQEFKSAVGYEVPYKKFGCQSLRSWLITLPNIYIVQNRNYQEVVIEQSPKSSHIKDMILKQKNRHRPAPLKRKCEDRYDGNEYGVPYKMKKRMESKHLPEGSHCLTSITDCSINNSDRHEKFKQLESMFPIFYKHQALGDDFFLDIADTKLGYYISESGPKICGLCSAGQTIAELTEKVQMAVNLAPRVVVMIGFQDLLNGAPISQMVTDLRHLILELKRKNALITLVTLIPSPKLPRNQRIQTRLDLYNRVIMDYAHDGHLKCNVINMYQIFQNESDKFRRDFERFRRVARNDPYRVFSDYGRKIFLNALKSLLKEQIEYGL